MSNVIVFVDALRQRAEAQAMCERANAEAMRRVFGCEASRRFTLRLTLTGRVRMMQGNRKPFYFVNARAALAYVGAMHAVGEYVSPLDGISGQYRIEQ